MSDRIGQQLGHYRLKRLLGQGGFAEVYLGEHTLLNTTVAIKILHTQVSPNDVAQFQEEAQLLASLKHPHIIRVLDFGLDGQTPYLVMDHAPNGTLRARHTQGTLLSVATVVGYVKQVAEALQYAHERKIVHRDIKPENMLINEKNEILLSDFGIALIAKTSRNLSEKDIAGTIPYMAPEQISAHPRPASDQYALGVVAYEWLCGTRPFDGSYAEVAIKHSITPPPSLRERLPMLSPGVEQVILVALAKKPEERFASVSAFATALEQASGYIQPTVQRPSQGTLPPLYSSVPPSNHITPQPQITPVPGSRTPQPVAPSTLYPIQSNPFPPRPVPYPGWYHTPPPLPTPPQPPRKSVSRRVIIISAATLVGVGSMYALFVAVRTGIQSWIQSFTSHFPNSQSQATPPPQITSSVQTVTYQGNPLGNVRAVAWSPNGKQIASGFDNNTVQVSSASDGTLLFTYKGHSDGVNTVAWSPDGKQIASGSDDNTVQVWNATDGSAPFTYKGHLKAVRAVAWSQDGKRVVSGSNDTTVKVWNAIDGGQQITYEGHTGGISSVAWSRDGRLIASGSDDKNDRTVQVWNAADAKNVYTYKGHFGTSVFGDPTGLVYAVAWSPDGKRVASGSDDKTVQVWNATDGTGVYKYTGHSGTVWGVTWSQDGKRIASGSDDKSVLMWDANNGGNALGYYHHTDKVNTVAWSPDGKWIVSGSNDQTVQVFSVV